MTAADQRLCQQQMGDGTSGIRRQATDRRKRDLGEQEPETVQRGR